MTMPIGGSTGPTDPPTEGAPSDPPNGQPQQTDPPKQDPPSSDPPKQDATLTQAQVDAIVKDRLAREREKFADYAELKRKAAEHDKLTRERETEHEKAIREAREKAEQDATAAIRPKLVMAEFRAAAAGKIEPERLATLTEDIDLTRYLKDDGSVDLDKITAKVGAWTPQSAEPLKTTPKPDRSQGSQGSVKTTGVDKGRAMYGNRRGRRPAE